MTTVLVTGGTGTLGRAVVPLLLGAGYDVRVFSRQSSPRLPAGVAAYAGDVRTGVGVDRAVAGADVVLHAATSPRHRAMDTEVEGTRAVAAAAAAAGAHLVYVSIVGVERHRYAYYRAKRAAELLVAQSGAPWTVLRATQFHDLIDTFLGTGLFFRTRNLAFQPVDVGEVASRLVDVVAASPAGLLPDFGGPEVVDIRRLAATRREVTGRATRLVPVPPVGFLADFDSGRHLTPEHCDGRRTWQHWLETGR